MTPSTSPPADTSSTTAARALFGVGLAVHLSLGAFPLPALGLLAPLWAIAAMYLVWAALGVLAWRARHGRPWAPLVAAVGTIALLQVVLLLGDALLGWTA